MLNYVLITLIAVCLAAPVPMAPELAAAYAASYIPFIVAFSNDYRVRNMTFIQPRKDQSFYPGQTFEFATKNYGLAARFRGRTADLYLLRDDDMRLVDTKPFAQFGGMIDVTQNIGSSAK
jgi:hypothetical protein